MLLRILLCSLYRPLLRSIQRILNLARKFGAAAFKNAGYLRALHVTAQRALEFQCNTRPWLDNGRITRLSNSKRSKAARAITTSRCKPLRSVCWHQKSGQWLITLPACAKTQPPRRPIPPLGMKLRRAINFYVERARSDARY